jgi:DNA-binding winged helix-turn-helix (wHTH) protein
MLSEHRPQNGAEPDRYNIAYRAAEASQVMRWVKAGQSGCIVGLRGVGKSNFLHFLIRDDVRQNYLGFDATDFDFILVDLLALPESAESAVWELILDRLQAKLRASGAAPQTTEEIVSLHKEVMRTKDPLIAWRACEQCVQLLCDRPTRHIIVFFDEFGDVFGSLDRSLFLGLRAIRDAHKGQVSYIVVVADELAYLRHNVTDIEQFYRLVSRNVCGLGPYEEADARQMIYHLISQQSVKLNSRDTACLLELSGGHAGLLKATLSVLWSTAAKTGLDEMAPSLKDEPVIQAECRKVWDSLSENEQTALCALISGQQPDPKVAHRLRLKGLIREGRAEVYPIFSPLFADFVRQQSPHSKDRMIIDRSRGMTMIDGQRVDLTELEFEMLCYLFDRRGQVCTKDELISNVYHQQYDRMVGDIDDARLQTLISRLRAKLEPPRYIRTIRGEGYKFVEPGKE